jgi:hypothetical protein
VQILTQKALVGIEAWLTIESRGARVRGGVVRGGGASGSSASDSPQQAGASGWLRESKAPAGLRGVVGITIRPHTLVA